MTKLWLQIDAAVYIVTPNPNIHRAWRLFKVPDGPLYDIARTAFGPTCDCADFCFRRTNAPEPCKHVRAAQEAGLL